MRILHIIATLTGGGAERFVAQLVPRISSRETESAIMTVYPSEIPLEVETASAVDVLAIGRRGRYDAAFLPRMIAAMRKWRPDVVHTHGHNGTYWGRLAAIAAGVPAIVRTEHLPCDPIARIRGTAIADRVLNAASAAILTFCAEQGRFLAAYEHFDPRKLVVIPNGIVHHPVPDAGAIAEGRRRLAIGDGTFAIFVLGNLHRHKNQRLAIEAIAAIAPEVRERIRLFFVGEGADRAALTQLVHDRGLASYVEFLGFRSDVASILPGADLVLMPSLTEGMPLALLEAMSAGVPVVSTPWIGAHDLLGDGSLGTLSVDWDPASVADSVSRSMLDPGATRALAQRAQAVVRRDYDIAVIAQRHRELYRALLDRKAAA
ncbi:MAG TPA: glycosyltransferase [Candidatus Baltobacteraceae bacterium]|jgi:glycosyltransferase involved in cell wall biosynthesis|nr:glycosyltransferase [Candidatus Baltobacteraceae bacterium]